MNLSGDWEKLAKKLENLATDTPQKVEMTLKQVAEQTIKEVKEETLKVNNNSEIKKETEENKEK